MTYLGTDLSPEEYYALHSKDYTNPHEDAITELLYKMVPLYAAARFLDLGCGPGLATKILQTRKTHCKFTGMDSSEEMIARYEQETQSPGIVGNFWNEYPETDIILAAHCLHLCPDERLYQTMISMLQSKANYLFMTSPNKHTVERFEFPVILYYQASSGEKQKTIHGWCLNLK